MTGIILAGGNNKRIKLDKAFLQFPSAKKSSSTLIEMILAKFKKIFDEIIIVTNSIEKYKHLGIKSAADIFPNKGSLGGIYTGLKNSSHEFNFITACDMPFLNSELIEFMMRFPRDYDVLIPKTNTGYETMFAIYSKECLKAIEKNIKKDKLKILDFFGELNVKEVGEESLKKIDDNFRHSFFNINTEEDYLKAVRVSQNSVLL